MIVRIVGVELLGAAAAASAVTGVYKVGVLVVEAVVLVAGTWLLIRGKQATQAIADAASAQGLASEWRENYLAERQAREDAQREIDEQRALKHEALNEAATLRAQRDLTAVMKKLAEIAELLEKIAGRFDQTDPPARAA